MARIDANVTKALQKFIRRLTKSGICIDAAYLFGSYARGTQSQWSDIDVAIISSSFSSNRFTERVRLAEAAMHVDNRIEPIPFRPESFVDEDPLAWEIKREGIRI